VDEAGGEVGRQDAQQAGEHHRDEPAGEVVEGEEEGEEEEAIGDEQGRAKDDADSLLNPFTGRVARGKDLGTSVLRAPTWHLFHGIFVIA